MLSIATRFALATGVGAGVASYLPQDKRRAVAKEHPIPLIGLGTAILKEKSEDAVLSALESGYRAIDTALLYDSHIPVGKALSKTDVPREEIFVTTKVGFFPTATCFLGQPANLPFCVENTKGEEHKGVDLSLKELGLDYVDLCLIHTPATTPAEIWTAFLPHYGGLMKRVPFWVCDASMAIMTVFLKLGVDHGYETRKKSWENMLELKKEGKCKAVGVSNYEVSHLEEMLKYTNELPAVNQIEMHPRYPRTDVINWCRERGVAVTAYGHHVCFEHQTETDSPTLLKWITEQGVSIVPRSGNPDHIKQNIEALKSSLTAAERIQLASVFSDRSYYWNTKVIPARA